MARQFQAYRTRLANERVVAFFDTVEAETWILYELFESDPALMADLPATRVLRALVANLEPIADLTLVRRDGTNVMVYREDGDDIGVEYNGELDEESLEIVRTGRPGDESEGFEDLYMEPTDRRPVISYTMHLGDGAGRPQGTIYLDLDVATLTEAMARDRTSSGDYLFLFDESGVVMAHPELLADAAGKTWEELPQVGGLDDPVPAGLARMIAEDGFVPDSVTVSGETWLTAVSEVAEIGDSTWYVVSAVPRGAVLGKAFARAWTIGAVGLVILGVAIGFSLWVGRLITAPVGRLAAAANAIQAFELELPAGRASVFEELSRAEGAFGAMLQGLRVFARYVPRSLVRQLVQLDAEGAGVVAENRVVSVLFTDIAGFTAIASAMGSDALAGMLNEYFTVLTEPVLAQGGTVDKFIGDALMAFWNAPAPQSDHADRAIAAALAIRRATAAHNRARETAGLPPLETRVGVHTGVVLVGDIGAEARLNHTIVGDAVNTASRLESLGKEIGCHLCISAETRAAATGRYDWHEVGVVRLRGRDSDTRVYTLDADAA